MFVFFSLWKIKLMIDVKELFRRIHFLLTISQINGPMLQNMFNSCFIDFMLGIAYGGDEI